MDVNNAEGSAQPNASGTGEGKPDSQQVDNQSKTVKFEDHKRAIDDMLKYKAAAKDLAQKQADLEAQLQAIKEDKLRAEGNKDQLLEEFKQKYIKSEQEKKQVMDSFFTSKKYDAVYTEAVKAGLRKEAEGDLGLLNLEGVDIEKTDAGRVIVHGHDSYVQKLKQTKPHWFNTNQAPNVNSGGARGYTGNEQVLTADELGKLAGTDPKKYRELLPKYVAQRQAARKV